MQWQITVRGDGQRLFNGALPSLIQWGKPEAADPCGCAHRNSWPRSGVTLQGIRITHHSAVKLQSAYEAIGLRGIPIESGPVNGKPPLLPATETQVFKKYFDVALHQNRVQC